MTNTIFLRLLAHDDKAAALAAAVDALRRGVGHPDIVHADPASFAQVPGSPMAYWVGEKVRKLYVTLQALESPERKARVGLNTTDDTRFLRLWW